MNTIVLKNETPEGEPLEATFLPGKGMNLISYKKGQTEVIDQSTKQRFDQIYEGLGAMIGPHFHLRKTETIPPIPNETKFPHIAKARELHVTDPFMHGVGRYAPWQAKETETSIRAQLSGKDEWNGVPLSSLEGQDFKMRYDVDLTPNGLQLDLSVVSETDSIIGIHYFYHLPNGSGTISAKIQDHYIVKNEMKPIPQDWKFAADHQLTFELNQDADFTFHPFPNPLGGQILLDTGSYRLLTTYTSDSQENAWQFYHPKGASFVCIEPVSSQDPRRPNLTVSSIKIALQIL